jgi:tetratricopeptide (TPR) repeat protein
MVDARLNLVWTCDTRVDCLNEETLYWMRKAGCYYMSVGIESGSEAMLALIDKKTNIAKIKKGAAMARRYGFWTRFYIIANLPGETTQDRQASIDIIEECKPNYVSVSLLKLSPRTELYRRFCKENNKDDNIWFDDPRFWIPYSEEESWNSSDVGKNLLSYKSRSEKSQLFAYTEAELRDIQSRLSDCFGPNLELAMYLMQQNRFAEAMRYFQISLDIYPDYTKGRISLGICLLNLNRLTEAKTLFSILGEKAGDNSLVWFMLGNTQLRLEAYREAEACYRKALTLNPDYVEAWGQLGNVLESLGRYDEALTAFKKILTLVPGEPQAGRSMIRILKAMKQQRVSQ